MIGIGNTLFYEEYLNPDEINTFVNYLPLDDYKFIMKSYEERFENKHFKQIGSGSFSIVFGYKDYAIKYYTDDDCNNDGEILKDIGSSEWFPKLYFYNEDFMVVEKINGITIEELEYDVGDNSTYIFKPICKSHFKNTLESLLEEKEYEANDIHNENIMVTKEGRFVIIDVGLFIKPNFRKIYDYSAIEFFIDKVNNIVKRNKIKFESKLKARSANRIYIGMDIFKKAVKEPIFKNFNDFN